MLRRWVQRRNHGSFGATRYSSYGIPFDPGTAERWTGPNGEVWHGEAKGGQLDLGLDQHNAHVQPDGTYHYHAIPIGLLDQRAKVTQPG